MRTRASSRFEAVCNISSSAVDRWEVLGVAVGEWSDIVFLQCGTQVGLSVKHLARQGNKRDNAVITVLLQGAFGDFAKMLPKSGFEEKEKLLNRCSTTI